MIQLPETVVDIRNGESDDSDWDDDDDDFRSRKINIRIKPAGQVKDPKISASVDELRATVDSWKSMANLNHLSKPSSRRSQYQSTVQLNQVDKFLDSQSILDLIPTNDRQMFNDHPYIEQQQTQPYTNLTSQIESQIENLVIAPKPVEILPIAIAIQECLNVKLTSSDNNNLQDFHIATGLKGCIKMAVPPKMLYMMLSNTQETMLLSFNCDFALNKIWINESFAKECNANETNHQFSPFNPQFRKQTTMLNDQFALNNFTNNNVTLSVDTNSIKAYIVDRYRNNTSAKYFVLPELFRYEVGLQGLTVEQNTSLTPILGYCNWIHESNDTKIKIDIEILEQILYQQLSLTNNDILDLKIILNFKGSISNHQSKPESSLDIINPNKLVWSFSDLHEFIQKSESNSPYYSCIARLETHQSNVSGNLVDDIELSFKIRDKNVTGTSVNIVNEMSNFKMTLVKSEVRTGSFRIQSVPGF